MSLIDKIPSELMLIMMVTNVENVIYTIVSHA